MPETPGIIHEGSHEVHYCPYCGSANVKLIVKVPRCLDCRAVFFLSFSRYARRTKPVSTTTPTANPLNSKPK